MSALSFKIEDPDDVLINKIFQILQDFLQPSSRLTVEDAARSILALLPDKAPVSTEVWVFGETCLEIAEQVPYHHPSQIKFAALFRELGKSSKFGSLQSSEGGTSRRYHKFQRLGESLREWLNDSPDPDDPSKYVNFHAFAAHLHGHGVFGTNPTWAIWEMREAHENDPGRETGTHEGHVLAAAQYILWSGQSLLKQVISPGDVSDKDLQYWKPGPLYGGDAHLSLRRWRFWRDGFNGLAYGGKEEEKAIGKECRDVSARAAQLMDTLEQSMIF